VLRTAPVTLYRIITNLKTIQECRRHQMRQCVLNKKAAPTVSKRRVGRDASSVNLRVDTTNSNAATLPA